MNLIEQLGGYEKAKRALDREIRLTSPNTFYCLKLNDALLEYRRQHNIYEEGDLVIDLWTGDNRLVVYKDDFIMKSCWRHATDAEIKAGKRL